MGVPGEVEGFGSVFSGLKAPLRRRGMRGRRACRGQGACGARIRCVLVQHVWGSSVDGRPESGLVAPHRRLPPAGAVGAGAPWRARSRDQCRPHTQTHTSLGAQTWQRARIRCLRCLLSRSARPARCAPRYRNIFNIHDAHRKAPAVGLCFFQRHIPSAAALLGYSLDQMSHPLVVYLMPGSERSVLRARHCFGRPCMHRRRARGNARSPPLTLLPSGSAGRLSVARTSALPCDASKRQSGHPSTAWGCGGQGRTRCSAPHRCRFSATFAARTASVAVCRRSPLA